MPIESVLSHGLSRASTLAEAAQAAGGQQLQALPEKLVVVLDEAGAARRRLLDDRNLSNQGQLRELRSHAGSSLRQIVAHASPVIVALTKQVVTALEKVGASQPVRLGHLTTGEITPVFNQNHDIVDGERSSVPPVRSHEAQLFHRQVVLIQDELLRLRSDAPRLTQALQAGFGHDDLQQALLFGLATDNLPPIVLGDIGRRATCNLDKLRAQLHERARPREAAEVDTLREALSFAYRSAGTARDRLEYIFGASLNASDAATAFAAMRKPAARALGLGTNS